MKLACESYYLQSFKYFGIFQAQFNNHSTHIEKVGWAQIFVFHTYLALLPIVKGQTNMFHVIIVLAFHIYCILRTG